MAFTLPRYLLPRVAPGFAPQSALRRQIPTITAIPHAVRAPLPTVRMRSHTSIKMEHPSARIVIDPSQMIEEETVRASKLEYYYPVRIGEAFQDRYGVIGKLGYGSASTVWLCHDLQNNKGYVALKVYIHRSKVHRELPIYAHIKTLNSEHAGLESLRKLLDSFEIIGPHGNHICLVHEALGMSLEELRDRVPDREFAADLVRQTLRDVLRVLHFFREEAHVVHTDIQPMNILMGVLDDSAFARFEREELQDPMPLKESSSHPVYLSRPMPFTKGSPLLCDLSEARFDDPENDDLIMPDVYRAPEVLLGMPWSYPVDVWGFAMTLWDLFQPTRLFSPHNGDEVYSEHHHLAQMVAFMGPPPTDFLQRSEKSKQFWDDKGNWLGQVPIPAKSLEGSEARLQDEEKELFLIFIRKMLQWRPEDRSDIQDLFTDEWFCADLIRSGKVVREEQDV